MSDEAPENNSNNTGPFLEEFERVVRSRGLRMTSQRKTIALAFFLSNAHVTVDELYDIVRERDDRIGHATVYRTLRFLEDAGLAQSHRFGNRKLCYEVRQHHHDHIICVECGHIQEFENQMIERLQDEVALQYGFEVQSHRMEIYGSCKNETCPRRV